MNKERLLYELKMFMLETRQYDKFIEYVKGNEIDGKLTEKQISKALQEVD